MKGSRHVFPSCQPDDCRRLRGPACVADGPKGPGAHFLQNWDADGDGAVSALEAAERRGMVFVTFDADGDGVLQPGEYAAFDAARAEDREMMREEMAGQGMGGGMGHGMGHGIGGGMALAGEEAMALAFNDVDGDGAVTRAEFEARTPDFLARMDRDGDGVITRGDFGPD